MEDKELVKRARAGDSAAFETLVLTYQQRVYNLALRMAGNPDDAFDLSQEAFLKAWKGLDGFHFESSFSTWLYRLTANACLDYLRAKKRRQTVSLTAQEENGEEKQLEIPDPALTPEQAVLAAEDRRLLARALDALEPDARAILTMRVINGMHYEQIAEVLEVREGTVKSRLSRAREKLRKKLVQIGNLPEDSPSVFTEGKEDVPWSAGRP